MDPLVDNLTLSGKLCRTLTSIEHINLAFCVKVAIPNGFRLDVPRSTIWSDGSGYAGGANLGSELILIQSTDLVVGSQGLAD